MKESRRLDRLFFLVLLILGTGGSISCIDDDHQKPFDPAAQFDIDIEAIDSYLEANLIEAETDSLSLIRYVMIEEGTGAFPERSDNVNIIYQGRLLNDEVFDGDTVTFRLNELIPAWQIMIPLVKEGGTIEFFSPSYYCYGPSGQGPIPPNTPLIFKVTLLEINP